MAFFAGKFQPVVQAQEAALDQRGDSGQIAQQNQAANNQTPPAPGLTTVSTMRAITRRSKQPKRRTM